MQTVLTKKQIKTFGPRFFTEHGTKYRITAKAQYDDKCGNGHNTFSLTADIDEARGNGWRESSGGCLHEEIAKHFPELAPLIKWHLVSSDESMHYMSHAVFLAGERDCHGLLKGEFRQHTSRGAQADGVAGVPLWELVLPEGGRKMEVYAHEKPAPVTLEWRAYGRTGEGKARELSAARSYAVWPDATDEELTAPGLADRLAARLPALMADFALAMTSDPLNFVF